MKKNQVSPLYLGSGILKIIPILAACLIIPVAALSVVFEIKYRIYDAFPMIGIVILLFVLSAYYSRHEKNGMKAALSAILAILTAWEFFYLADWVANLFSETPLADAYDAFSFVVRIISCVLYLSIIVCHFLLTTEHKSNPRRVMRNTYAFMLTVAVFVVALAVDFATYSSAVPGKKWWAVGICTICSRLFEILALLEVVEIEILLDMFRSRREQKSRLKTDDDQQ